MCIPLESEKLKYLFKLFQVPISNILNHNLPFSRFSRYSRLNVYVLPKKIYVETVGGVCNFLCSVSPQQKFEATDRPVS